MCEKCPYGDFFFSVTARNAFVLEVLVTDPLSGLFSEVFLFVAPGSLLGFFTSPSFPSTLFCK